MFAPYIMNWYELIPMDIVSLSMKDMEDILNMRSLSSNVILKNCITLI